MCEAWKNKTENLIRMEMCYIFQVCWPKNQLVNKNTLHYDYDSIIDGSRFVHTFDQTMTVHLILE